MIFLGIDIVSGIVSMIKYWKISYQNMVNRPVVMLFTWFMIFRVIGVFKIYFNGNGKVVRYFSYTNRKFDICIASCGYIWNNTCNKL